AGRIRGRNRDGAGLGDGCPPGGTGRQHAEHRQARAGGGQPTATRVCQPAAVGSWEKALAALAGDLACRGAGPAQRGAAAPGPARADATEKSPAPSKAQAQPVRSPGDRATPWTANLTAASCSSRLEVRAVVRDLHAAGGPVALLPRLVAGTMR